MTTVYGSEWQRVQPPPVTEDSCTDVWGPLGRYVAEKQQIRKMNIQWCPDLVYPDLVDCRDLVD